MRLFLIACLGAACLALPAAASAEDPENGCWPTGPAEGTKQRYTCQTGPVTVGGFEVKQIDVAFGAPHPDVAGSIVAMDVDVTERDGTPIPIDRLMLHHIVFSNAGPTIGSKHDATCGQFTMLDSATKLPAVAERFYGAGEERAKLALPAGYGYPHDPADQWGLTWMFMNHRIERDTAYIRYHVTIDTAADLAPVTPYWLDVENCKADPVYDVPGGGDRGSTHTQTKDFPMPAGGRIVAAGGHVHGGAKQLTVTEPSCADRTLYRSRPAWGLRDHPFYRVKPILHEPGPIAMSGTLSQRGIPVSAGTTLRLSSEYDGELPHTRVMGITVLYMAHDAGVTEPCAPLPDDRVEIQQTTAPHRTEPPRFTVPLTGIDPRGRAVAIKRPPGRTTDLGRRGTVRVTDAGFARSNVRLRRGGSLTWRFDSKELHNVTLASGPRGFSSAHLNGGRRYRQRFAEPGTYRLMCGLHPVSMTETVKVR